MIGNNTHTIDAVIHSSGLVLEVMGGEKLYGTQNLDMHVGELLHDHRTRLLDRLSNTFGPAGNERNEINGTSFSYCQSEHKHHPLFFLYKVYKSMRECSGMIHGESSLLAFLSLFFQRISSQRASSTDGGAIVPSTASFHFQHINLVFAVADSPRFHRASCLLQWYLTLASRSTGPSCGDAVSCPFRYPFSVSLFDI